MQDHFPVMFYMVSYVKYLANFTHCRIKHLHVTSSEFFGFFLQALLGTRSGKQPEFRNDNPAHSKRSEMICSGTQQIFGNDVFWPTANVLKLSVSLHRRCCGRDCFRQTAFFSHLIRPTTQRMDKTICFHTQQDLSQHRFHALEAT